MNFERRINLLKYLLSCLFVNGNVHFALMSIAFHFPLEFKLSYRVDDRKFKTSWCTVLCLSLLHFKGRNFKLLVCFFFLFYNTERNTYNTELLQSLFVETSLV